MTFTAIMRFPGRSNGRCVGIERGPCFLVDFCLQCRFQQFVGVVRTEEIGVADELDWDSITFAHSRRV